MIFGILSISNASNLGYPFVHVVSNLSQLCDHVFVGVDPTYPEDRQSLEALHLSNLKLIDSIWDRSYKECGREIAVQMDKIVSVAHSCGAKWVVVLQADEFLHEDNFSILREFMSRDEVTNGFCLTRLYFWQTLDKIRIDWNADLVRIFRPGTYSFLSDDTDKAGMYSGQITEGVETKLPYYIYHYSRVDDPNKIANRVRNLDSFFHEDSILVPVDSLPAYDFKTREYDNYNINNPPPEKEGRIESFFGNHPKIVLSHYYKDGR